MTVAEDRRGGRLEQACPDCGVWEAAGEYCTGCRRPMGPDDWYRNGDETRRAVAHQRAAEKAQTRVKRPRGRPSGASVGGASRSAPNRTIAVTAGEDNGSALYRTSGHPTPDGDPRRLAPTGSLPPGPVGAPSTWTVCLCGEPESHARGACPMDIPPDPTDT